MEWTGVHILGPDLPQPYVRIRNPHPALYQIYHKNEDRDIFFFCNSHRKQSIDFAASFALKDKVPWVWNPETGDRHELPGKGDDLDLELRPLQSMLLVFEPGSAGEPIEKPKKSAEGGSIVFNAPWIAEFRHVNGSTFHKEFAHLIDFKSSGENGLNTFAGEVVYETSFALSDTNYAHLDLGDVKGGITEVTLNGKRLGLRWYGEHKYDLADVLKTGDNALEIRYTTILLNYCKSLKHNPTAQIWTVKQEPASIGVTGPVRLKK
jgi:hypothetical protein